MTFSLTLTFATLKELEENLAAISAFTNSRAGKVWTAKGDAVTVMTDVEGSQDAATASVSDQQRIPPVKRSRKPKAETLTKVEDLSQSSIEEVNVKQEENQPETVPEPTPAPAPASVTYDDVKKITLELIRKKGKSSALDVLSDLGVKSAPELKPEQYAAYIAAAVEMMGRL